MGMRRIMMFAGAVAAIAACADKTPTALPLGGEAGLAKGGGGGTALYKARFVADSPGTGEITSDWFPPEGFSVSLNNPWGKWITFHNVTLQLTNYTHGDTAQGTCKVFLANYALPLTMANWDLDGSDPVRSYAGTWSGSVTFKSGYLAFDGDRVDGAGGIHNVVAQNNVAAETVGDNKEWFRQDVRNAAFKFGGASTPDATPTTDSEMACVNYTIELRKVGTF